MCENRMMQNPGKQRDILTLELGRGWPSYWGPEKQLIHIRKLLWGLSKHLSHSCGLRACGRPHAFPRWQSVVLCVRKQSQQLALHPAIKTSGFLPILWPLGQGFIGKQIYIFSLSLGSFYHLLEFWEQFCCILFLTEKDTNFFFLNSIWYGCL